VLLSVLSSFDPTDTTFTFFNFTTQNTGLNLPPIYAQLQAMTLKWKFLVDTEYLDFMSQN